jgi:acyltransferase
MRTKSIDVAKGILILLVIAGHVLLGGPATLLHYIIYSFHMPLFIALSGWLVNWEKLRELSFGGLGQKYLDRVIIPWVLALIVYGLVNNPGFLSHPLRFISAITTGIIRPFLHLWFIPAYLSWVLISWLLLKCGLTIGRIFIISLLLSASCSYLRYEPASVNGPLSDTLLTTFRPDYYTFFVLGGFLRNYKKMPPIGLTLPLSVLLFIGDVLLFFYTNPFLSIILFFLFNGCLICLMLTLTERWKSVAHPFLEWVGLNSLGIYLWHVLPILFAFRFVAGGPVLFYSLAIGLESVLFVFVYFTAKIAFFQRYFYGLGPV